MPEIPLPVKTKCKDGTNGKSIAEVYQLDMVWIQPGGDVAINTFHYHAPDLALSPSAWNDFCAGWWTAVGTAYRECQSTALTAHSINMADMMIPREHHIIYLIPDQPNGSLPALIEDAQSAVQVSWVTFESFQGGHSGFRLGPVPAGNISNGRVLDSYKAVVESLASTILTYHGGETDTFKLVAPRACDGTFFEVIGFDIQTVAASQDTREPTRGI